MQFSSTTNSNLLWSVVERVFPKVSSAVMLVMLAKVSAPAVVGNYAWSMILLLLVQSVTDTAVKQVAVMVINTVQGESFLRNYVKLTPWFASTFMALSLYVSSLFNSVLAGGILLLMPVALIPLVSARRVKSVALLQRSGHWKQLAKGQLLAFLISVGISLPVLLATRSLLGPVTQLLVTEICMTIFSNYFSKQATVDMRETSRDNLALTEYLHVAGSSLVSWMQSQSDRMLIAVFAGTSNLGLYSFSWAISRTAGDTLSNAVINVLRPLIGWVGESSPREIAKKVDPLLLRALLMSFSVITATWIGIHFFLRAFLGLQWNAALGAASIMAVAIIPSLLAWALETLLISQRKAKFLTPVKILGTFGSISIAYVANISLNLAGLCVVFRELIELCFVMILNRNYLPKKSLTWGIVATFLLTTIGWALAIG